MIGTGALIAAGAVAAVIAVNSRPTIPEGVAAVRPFDLASYLGKWYEIARFDFGFEKNGLSHVTAEYTLDGNGRIMVVNRGYDPHTKRWKVARGKARLVGADDEAMLKVSFFGPFYAGYNVVAIDRHYRYALVVGRNRDYLWLLSREKDMPDRVAREYLDKAAGMGFDLSRVVWTEQK